MWNTRQLILAAIGVVALGAAACLFLRRGESIAPSETFTLDGICLACQQPVRTTYHSSQRQPAVCPLCRERAVYGTFYCSQCRIRFVPALEDAGAGEPPRMPMVPVCPKCHRAGGAGYLPEDPDHAKAVLGPLPRWRK